MKNVKAMTTDEIRGEIFRLRNNEDAESIGRVAILREELNLRLKDVPLPKEEDDIQEEGSFVLGFALAYFLSLFGCIVALLIDKPRTKKGAIWGLIFEFITAFVVLMVFVLFVWRVLS